MLLLENDHLCYCTLLQTLPTAIQCWVFVAITAAATLVSKAVIYYCNRQRASTCFFFLLMCWEGVFSTFAVIVSTIGIDFCLFHAGAERDSLQSLPMMLVLPIIAKHVLLQMLHWRLKQQQQQQQERPQPQQKQKQQITSNISGCSCWVGHSSNNSSSSSCNSNNSKSNAITTATITTATRATITSASTASTASTSAPGAKWDTPTTSTTYSNHNHHQQQQL